jgi:hypothetical protein
LIVALLVAPGCVRRKKITQVQVDKSIVHSSGTFNLKGTTAIRPEIQAVSKSGESLDLRGMSESAFETFLGGRDSVEATSVILFDNQALRLETKAISRRRDLSSLEKTLDKRMDSVNKFLKSKDSQLDARKW